MSVNFFTTHPFSVMDQNGKPVNLQNKDMLLIGVATLVGSLFFGIGAIFGFFGASYYLRKKKITELKQNDPGAQKVSKLGSETLNKPATPSPTPSVTRSPAPSPAISPTPIATPSKPAPTPASNPTPSVTRSPAPSPAINPTPIATPSKPAPTPASNPTPSVTPSPAPSPAINPTPTATPSKPAPTPASSPTPSVTPSPTSASAPSKPAPTPAPISPPSPKPASPATTPAPTASQTSTLNITKPFKKPTPDQIDYTGFLLPFDKKLEEMMGKNYLKEVQYLFLFDLLAEAMVSAEPRKTFQSLYEKEGNKPNKTGKWTEAKFPFFKKDLLPLIPEENISRQNYDEGIRTMSKHIKDHQKPVLEQIYKDAMNTAYPRQSFSILIRNELEKGYGNQIHGQPAWTINKIEHLEKNLLPALPIQIIFPPPPQQKQGQGTFSSTINNSQNPPIPVPHSPANTNILNEITSISASNFVAFYKIGPTECFGNFWICPNGITLGNLQFRCAEAAFQCQKICIAAAELERKIQNREMTKTTKMQEFLEDQKWKKFLTADGDRAFDLKKEYNKDYGQLFNNKFNAVEPSDWVVNKSCPQFPSLRDQVMWDILQAKLAQNPQFVTYLNATGKAYLLEHNEKVGRDIYWSDNHDGKGSNMLGRMLMALRDNQNIPSPTQPGSQEHNLMQKFTNLAQNVIYKMW